MLTHPHLTLCIPVSNAVCTWLGSASSPPWASHREAAPLYGVAFILLSVKVGPSIWHNAKIQHLYLKQDHSAKSKIALKKVRSVNKFGLYFQTHCNYKCRSDIYFSNYINCFTFWSCVDAASFISVYNIRRKHTERRQSTLVVGFTETVRTTVTSFEAFFGTSKAVDFFEFYKQTNFNKKKRSIAQWQ